MKVCEKSNKKDRAIKIGWKTKIQKTKLQSRYDMQKFNF